MKQKSKFFLVYSIALFSVALILILFSTFTGMRYKEENESTKGLYANAKSSAEALTKQNEELNEEITKKETEIKDLRQKNKDLTEEKEKLEAEEEKTETLLKVQLLLSERRYNEAKELFDSIEDPSVLGENGQLLYEKIRTSF